MELDYFLCCSSHMNFVVFWKMSFFPIHRHQQKNHACGVLFFQAVGLRRFFPSDLRLAWPLLKSFQGLGPLAALGLSQPLVDLGDAAARGSWAILKAKD